MAGAIETTLTPERIAGCTRTGAWPNKTLGEYLDRWVSASPAKVAAVDAVHRDTDEDLARRADRIAPRPASPCSPAAGRTCRGWNTSSWPAALLGKACAPWRTSRRRRGRRGRGA